MLEEPGVSPHSRNVDRMQGCLLLGAVGDAFGYAVEFESIAAIAVKYGGRLRFRDVAHWADARFGHLVSDDTQMSMFTAQACAEALEAGRGYSELRSRARLAYLDWLETQRGRRRPNAIGLLSHHEMYARRAPGNTCLSALGAGGDGSTIAPINDSKGCGGVMRIAPVAFMPGLDDDEAWSLGCELAALTHGHPLGWASSGALVILLRRIVAGLSVREAAEETALYVSAKGVEVLTLHIERALTMAGRETISPSEIESLGGGWVAEECLAIGIAAAVMNASTDSMIETAVNHSGDSDSTALVAGQRPWALRSGES